MDAFDNLSALLTEMQCELMRREWSDDAFKRINQSVEFRGRLWDAICAYADDRASIWKPS